MRSQSLRWLGFFSLRSKDLWRGNRSKKHLKTSSPSASCVFLCQNPHLSKLISVLGIKKTSVKRWFSGVFGGERGIRTPGTSRYAGFQDQCIRPLCHLSDEKNELLEWAANLNRN